MARVIFGNHAAVIVPQQDRDSIRQFFCDVLGGKIVQEDTERDFICLGEDFYIGFLYGNVPDESEFLRTARSIWLEIKSDNVEETTRKILGSGVRKLDIPDPHLYFQAPGGQVLRLVGIVAASFNDTMERTNRPTLGIPHREFSGSRRLYLGDRELDVMPAILLREAGISEGFRVLVTSPLAGADSGPVCER